MESLRPFVCLILLPASSSSQSAVLRHDFEFGAAGLFPVSGYRAVGYSAGPGLRAGYEFRALKHFGAEAGFTDAWPVATEGCNRFGCTYSRQSLKLLDYGLRGVALLAGNRVELSIGLGGGYVWHPYGFSGPFGPNGHLLQYSGKAASAVDRSARFRLAVGVRTWRDLSRPTQQWLSTTGGVVISLGDRP